MKKENLVEQFINQLADAVVEKMNNRSTSSVSQHEYYTVKQVCEKLHISKATLYRHRVAGYLVPAKYIGRSPLFNQNSLDEYLDSFSV